MISILFYALKLLYLIVLLVCLFMVSFMSTRGIGTTSIKCKLKMLSFRLIVSFYAVPVSYFNGSAVDVQTKIHKYKYL